MACLKLCRAYVCLGVRRSTFPQWQARLLWWKAIAQRIGYLPAVIALSPLPIDCPACLASAACKVHTTPGKPVSALKGCIFVQVALGSPFWKTLPSLIPPRTEGKLKRSLQTRLNTLKTIKCIVRHYCRKEPLLLATEQCKKGSIIIVIKKNLKDMEANNPQSKMPPLNLISAGWKGIRFVSPEAKQAYFRYVHAISVRKQQEGGELIAEVKALGEAIDSDPAIRMCLQNGLDILAKGNDPKVPLTNNSIADTLRDINTVATTPPVFQNRLFVGMPFSILFVGLFNNPFGQRFLGSPVVNYHLNKIFNVYALLLQSPASQAVLNQENGWLCPEARKFVDYKDFVHDQTDPFYGFSSWNSWFTRSFAQGARPIDPNPLRITNSSDHYCVDVPKQPVCHAQKSSSFWLKDDNYSLYDMFCVNKMGQEIKKIVDESFVDGTVYQGYLSPWCYHHWHAPVAGTIQKSYKITGSYVHEITCCYAEKSVSEQALLTSLSTRHIFIINTHHPAIGRVAVVQVGMGQVMSCNSFVEEGAIVEKGQEIGRFEFGGSTHAIVFDRRATLKFNPQIYQMQDSHPKLQKVGVWLAEASLPS